MGRKRFDALRRVYRRLRKEFRSVLLGVGVDVRTRSRGRAVLEDVIFPAFARREDCRKVLFVGCQWYTRGYGRRFRGKEYWTLEPDPRQRRYGARDHIVDGMENLGKHFPGRDLDLIVCNGVFGWGLNERGAVEEAFRGALACLRPSGILVLGWDDEPDHHPFPPEECARRVGFEPAEFAPFGSWRHLADPVTRHTFDFYEKPGAPPHPGGLGAGARADGTTVPPGRARAAGAG